MKSLTFAKEYVEPVVDGEKYLTIRYRPNGGELEAGDDVELFADDGEKFGEAYIEDVIWMDQEAYISWNPDGHESYTSPEELYQALKQYYPDIDPDDTVKVIEFDFKK